MVCSALAAVSAAVRVAAVRSRISRRRSRQRMRRSHIQIPSRPSQSVTAKRPVRSRHPRLRVAADYPVLIYLQARRSRKRLL